MDEFEDTRPAFPALCVAECAIGDSSAKDFAWLEGPGLASLNRFAVGQSGPSKMTGSCVGRLGGVGGCGFGVSPPIRLRQWSHPRPAGSADRLLASASLHHPHRIGRPYHRAGRPLHGQAPEFPNDVICRSDGTSWFSDPHYGINTDYEGGKQTAELPRCFIVSTRRMAACWVMADDFEGPNGLAFSPDERLLYVAESGRQFAADPTQHIRVFDVLDDGRRLSPAGSFTRSRPALRTASAWTRMATSGAAPPTACIASHQTALNWEVSKCRSRYRTSPSAAVTGRGFSSARRTRCLRSTPTSAASSAPDPLQILSNLASR